MLITSTYQFHTPPITEPHESIAQRKQHNRLSLLPLGTVIPNASPYSRSVEDGGPLDVSQGPRDCGLLNQREIEITEMDAGELLTRLREGKLKSREVTEAFIKRASIAQQLVNCITEIFFDEALARADELDKQFAETGKVVGPLHGLPISLKDNMKVKGHPSSVGYVAWAERKEDEDSVITALLRQAGAVLYVKTNVPTSLMHGDTYNNVWGYTCSPLNRNLSAGGSSGGEAALIRLRGSPLGVGTDIGGSVRIPASACNVFSLRPSYGRFPTLGHRSAMPGQETIRNVNGPISTSLEGIEAFSKAIVGAEAWKELDPRLLPIPWREVTLPTKLTFAVLYDDGLVRPHPPILRGLRQTVASLRAAGHEVIEFPNDVALWQEGQELLMTAYGADGGDHIRDVIDAGGEPWIPGLKDYKDAEGPGLSVRKLWELHMKKDAWQVRFAQQWNSTSKLTKTGRPIDGLICPATPYASAKRYGFDWVAYTSTFNLADYTAMVIPHSRVDPAIDVVDKDYKPRNSYDKHVYEQYDSAEYYKGGAVAIQLVGRRLEEEKVLEMGKVVHKVLKAEGREI